ncbi:hypothetical protein MMC17_000771 [Xylographa soralifera]|nr:hypothetical protein [Xylographa soralifera]
MLIPKFSDHNDLLRGKSNDRATMERKDGQSSRKQERARPRARAEELGGEEADEKAHLMLNDLGLNRASFVTAADFARNSRPVNVAALEQGRAFRRPGTAAYTAAQENQGQLSAWTNAYVELRDDGADDRKAVLDNGQGHRTVMMQMLQQPGPFAGNRGGGQGGRAHGSGRGGGVMGTRGRGNQMVSSSHQQHASQEPNLQANQSNTASQSLAIPTVTDRRAALSSPRHRDGPRASASPRGRDDRRAEISTFAGPSSSSLSVNRALPLPVEASSNPTPRQRWSGAVAERTSVDQQTQVRPTVRLPPNRPTRSPPNLANPSDFMSAMTRLRISDSSAAASGAAASGAAASGAAASGAAASGAAASGAAASGSTDIRVEGASTVTVKETAKSTVTELSGSISIKTTGSDRESRASPEIIFSPEIDAAPYGVRVLTPPPVSQRSISPGTYSDDLIGLEIEVPRSVKAEEEAADNPYTEAHLHSSEQARSTTEQAIDLSNAQTLLNTLRGLSGLSSLPSVAQAIADLEATIGNIHDTHTTTSTRSGAEIAGPLDSSSTPIQVEDIGRAAAHSSQGSANQDPPLRKSSSDSAASQPSITASSHRSSTLSQSGNLSARVQRLQDQWTTGVMIRLREVLSITMRDLEQSLHHDPSSEYQPRVSTRVRLPTTNLGEYLLPVGSGNEQTAPLSAPRTTSIQNEAARNTVVRGQVRTSRPQEPRSSNSLDEDFFTKAIHKTNKGDYLQQDTQKTIYGSQDLDRRDRTNASSDSRNTTVPRPINPFQQQSSATVTLPSQRVQSTSFHRRAPTSTSMTSFPEVTRTNTVDAVRGTILPNIAPVNPFLQHTSAFSTPSAPHFTISLDLPTALSRPGADASSNPRIIISPRGQRLPGHPTMTRAAETASNMATRTVPSTLSTILSSVAPSSAATALGGGVSTSRWSTATSSIPSTLTTASNTAALLPISAAPSGGVGASRRSTASNALSSTSNPGTGVTTSLPTATAFGGGVGASRWSTATDANSSLRELRSTTNLPPSSGHSQTLRGTAPGSSGLSTSADLELNDTSSLFSNYQRPQVQQTRNVPEFILQAQALQDDPGAAARAQYGMANTMRTNLHENQTLSPSAVSIPESASGNISVRRSKDPWDPARRRRL